MPSFKAKSIILFLLLFHLHSWSQIVRRPVSSVYTGLGAYSINQADVFSFGANQASLSQLKKPEAGVFAERRFLLEELSLYQAAVGLPTPSGNFGLRAGYYGFSDYNETQLGLAYARSLGNKLDLGVQFNHHGVSIRGYGNASAITIEIGALMHLSEKLHAGIHAYNPAGSKLGKNDDEKLASVYTMGFGYEVSEILFISAEIEKDENQPVNVNTGFQYRFLPQLLARAGISTSASVLYLGAGLFLKSARLDVTASYHPQLGITPGMLVLFHFDKK